MSEIARLFRIDMDAVRCPFPIYDQLRATAPVQFVEDVGCYVVTGYEEAVAVLQDAQRFASQDVTGIGPSMKQLMDAYEKVIRLAGFDPDEMMEKWAPLLLMSADPDHARYRTLLGKAFAPNRVRELEDTIRQVSTTLVDDFGDGPVDFATAFAVPLPMTTIATIIGVPTDDWSTFRQWAEVFLGAMVGGAPTGEGMVHLFRTLNEFEDYFNRQLADRLHTPQNDVLTDIARAVDDGQVTRQQAIHYLLELLAAGNQTITNHLLNTLVLVLHHPGLWTRLRADRSLVRKLVEESLRLEAPVQGFYRTATADVTLAGVTIPADARVYVSYQAANRDAHQFDHPDTMEIERANATRHIAFGRGPHTCLGAPLARIEARIGIEVLVDRFADLALASPNEELDYLQSYMNRGLHHLRLIFTPAM